MIAEQKLWMSVIHVHVDAAMGVFSMHNTDKKTGQPISLDKQYDTLLKKWRKFLTFQQFKKRRKKWHLNQFMTNLKRYREEKDEETLNFLRYLIKTRNDMSAIKLSYNRELDFYKNRDSLYVKLPMDIHKSRYFLETESFDDTAIACGYDTYFVRKTFDYVQKAITLEKKLHEEIKKYCCQNQCLM